MCMRLFVLICVFCIATMSWSNEKILHFIHEYEKRPILWQKNHNNYYNIVKKEDAWREISEICNEEIAVLKKKIESLRGSRRREKNRVRQSKRRGKGRSGIYTSKWFAWDALKFLEDPDKIRTTISNYSEEEDSIEDVEPVDVTDYLQQNSDEFDDEQVKKSSKPSNPTEKKFVSRKRVAPKRKRFEDPRIKAFDILQKTVKTEKKDECALFGEYIAEKLRKHPNRTRMILQNKIHNLLFEAEMQSQSPIETPQTEDE